MVVGENVRVRVNLLDSYQCSSDSSEGQGRVRGEGGLGEEEKEGKGGRGGEDEEKREGKEE